jgi:hypothetical protein
MKEKKMEVKVFRNCETVWEKRRKYEQGYIGFFWEDWEGDGSVK